MLEFDYLKLIHDKLLSQSATRNLLIINVSFFQPLALSL